MTSTEQIDFTTPSQREAVLTRIFDAPRDLVFATILNPELIPDWWGPKRFTVRVDGMDVRAGGEWRFVLRDNVSRVFAFRGTFRHIRPPESVSYTFEFEGLPGHAVVMSAEFDDVDGVRTRVTFRSEFESQSDRDAAMRWGVREGALETADRFTALLARFAAGPEGRGAG